MPLSKRKRSLIMLTIFVFGCAIWSVVGVTIRLNPQPPVTELRTARDHWQRVAPAHYRLTIAFSGPFNPLGGVRYTVEDNRVTHMEWANLFAIQPGIPAAQVENTEWYYSPYGYSIAFLPSINQYTMDNLFAFAEEKISQEPTPPVVAWCGSSDGNVGRIRYEATYDEEKGYITSLQRGNCVAYEFGLGLLCPVTSDCSFRLRVVSLEPLP
ncbi:MAG: hypothetical protein U0528_17040 [Anaerolineae bacterium]